jgi:hypothetical protein
MFALTSFVVLNSNIDFDPEDVSSKIALGDICFHNVNFCKLRQGLY